MIAEVRFRNFQALRSASVRLEPFNLVIGPNGSGKTSLIQALLRLRSLAALPAAVEVAAASRTAARARSARTRRTGGPEIDFHFGAPFDGITVRMFCVTEMVCDALHVEVPPGAAGDKVWAELQVQLRGIRGFLFDHYAMAVPAPTADSAELASNAGNLAAVLAARQRHEPAAFARLLAEFRRILPEFSDLEFRDAGGGRVELLCRDAEEGELIPADSISQGVLYLLAVLTLALAPHPPSIVCVEEADRGVHPRILREVQDALYRLSHPRDGGETRAPSQVIATTHSPYLLDLFRERPEEIVLANKRGRSATFERLSDRPDVLELMKEANLGDLWFSGILGGVPGAE
jgi:predicted ATPase